MVFFSCPRFDTVEAARTVSSILSFKYEIFTAEITLFDEVTGRVATPKKVPRRQGLLSNLRPPSPTCVYDLSNEHMDKFQQLSDSQCVEIKNLPSPFDDVMIVISYIRSNLPHLFLNSSVTCLDSYHYRNTCPISLCREWLI